MSKSIFILTTIPGSLNFFEGQIKKLNEIYDVKLISSDEARLKETALKEGVSYKSIPMVRDISIFRDFISFFLIIFYFLINRPYAIHCNTPKASLLGLIAGFFVRVPVRIYYIHGLRYEGARGKKRKLLKAIECVSCWCATDIIAVSNGVKAKVEEGITKKSIKVILNGSPNGIDVDKFINYKPDCQNTKKDLNISRNDFVFGYVGRLVADKGINELVHAFNMLEQKNVKLVMVGRYEHELDPLTQETLDIIKTNSNIIEVGFQKDVKKFLAIMDLFVSPSYREGFGLSVLEANLMKVPVLVTSITGYSEIVKEGKNGFFVNPKDTLALFNKMKKFSQSRDSLLAMKQQCYDEVASKYNHKEVLEKALEYYAKFK